jgi:hypothetical protein
MMLARRPCAKAIVDIDDGHAGTAAVEHAQQRRQAVETRPVTNTRRHGNDRFVHQAADDTRQGAFHSGHDDQDIGRPDDIELAQKPVDAGNADIVDPRDTVSHDFRRQGSLFRHGEVAGPGGHDRDDTLFIFGQGLALQDEQGALPDGIPSPGRSCRTRSYNSRLARVPRMLSCRDARTRRISRAWGRDFPSQYTTSGKPWRRLRL